jgi:hypothetical protein
MSNLSEYQKDFLSYVLRYRKMGVLLAFCVGFTAISLGSEVASWVFQSPTFSSFLARLIIAIILTFGIVAYAKSRLGADE